MIISDKEELAVYPNIMYFNKSKKLVFCIARLIIMALITLIVIDLVIGTFFNESKITIRAGINSRRLILKYLNKSFVSELSTDIKGFLS